jgi:transposase
MVVIPFQWRITTMANKRYRVTLTAEERAELTALVEKGKAAARTLTHARILLKADQSEGAPGWTDAAIVTALDVSLSTVSRVREAFVEAGLETALRRRPASKPRSRKLDGVQEAHLIALACSKAPAGHARWSLRLLADRMVRLEYVDAVSHETVRQTLKKTNSSPG